MRVDMARAQIPGPHRQRADHRRSRHRARHPGKRAGGREPQISRLTRIAAATNVCDGSDTDWSDYVGHGTHVAGTILGSGAASPGDQQFAGVAPGASLVVQSLVPAPLSAESTPSRDFCSFDKTELLADAYAHGARILNASWGGPIVWRL